MCQSDYPGLFVMSMDRPNSPSRKIMVEDVVSAIIDSGKSMVANFIRTHKVKTYPTVRLASLAFNRTGILSGAIYSRIHLNNSIEVTGSTLFNYKWVARFDDVDYETSYHELKKMMDVAPVGSIYQDVMFSGMRNLNEYVKVDLHTWLYNGSISLIEPRTDDTRTRMPIGMREVIESRLNVISDPTFEVMMLIATESMVKMYDFLFAIYPTTPHRRAIRKDLNPKAVTNFDMTIRPLASIK